MLKSGSNYLSSYVIYKKGPKRVNTVQEHLAYGDMPSIDEAKFKTNIIRVRIKESNAISK